MIGIRPGPGHAELDLAPSAEPSAIIAAVVRRGAAVSRFEVAEPSLEALFVEVVGRPSEADGGAAAVAGGGVAVADARGGGLMAGTSR